MNCNCFSKIVDLVFQRRIFIFLISDLGVHKYVARRINLLEVERSRMACVVRLSGPDANEGLQRISPNVAKVRMEYCWMNCSANLLFLNAAQIGQSWYRYTFLKSFRDPYILSTSKYSISIPSPDYRLHRVLNCTASVTSRIVKVEQKKGCRAARTVKLEKSPLLNLLVHLR